jgi:hypothetical protein
MNLPSWHKCMEDAREASLEFTAAWMEAYSDLRSSRCGCGRMDCRRCRERPVRRDAHCRSSGDFVYDFLRLNINHVSQLALLGSSYAGLITRALGRYSACERGVEGGGASCEVQLLGFTRGDAVGRFSVRNKLCESAELVIDGLTNGSKELRLTAVGNPNVSFPAKLEVRDLSGVLFSSTRLATGDSLTLLVKLLLDKVEPGRYCAEFVPRLGGRSKPVYLMVDVQPIR